jgi:hypothetical protein
VGPTITFAVWRWDQDRNAEDQEFSSVPEVEAHLEALAALPAYRLDLVGNSTVSVISQNNVAYTAITDTSTGREFYVRTLDMEAVTSIVIHCGDGPPTVGNWRLDGSTTG